MSQSEPRLVTFGISHYCEKARWALDWHGIAYEKINCVPRSTKLIGFRSLLGPQPGSLLLNGLTTPTKGVTRISRPRPSPPPAPRDILRKA